MWSPSPAPYTSPSGHHQLVRPAHKRTDDTKPPVSLCTRFPHSHQPLGSATGVSRKPLRFIPASSGCHCHCQGLLFLTPQRFLLGLSASQGPLCPLKPANVRELPIIHLTFTLCTHVFKHVPHLPSHNFSAGRTTGCDHSQNPPHHFPPLFLVHITIFPAWKNPRPLEILPIFQGQVQILSLL